jgi:hypothetical protein
MVCYRLGETKGNGNDSVVIFAAVRVMVCYRLGRRREMENFSVVMCAGLVQCGGEGGKWNGFSGVVFWFVTGWRKRIEMERF